MPRTSPRRTATAATTVATGGGQCPVDRRRARRGRVRCGSSTGTRTCARVRPGPGSPTRRCLGCCSRRTSPDRVHRCGHSAATMHAARPPQSNPHSTARSMCSASSSSSRSFPNAACWPDRGVDGVEESGRAVAAQMRHNASTTGGGQPFDGGIVAADRVGKAVHQQHRWTVRRSRLLVGDVEHRGRRRVDRGHPAIVTAVSDVGRHAASGE